MTVNASAGYRKDYTGNGSTTLFPVPFYFLDASHLQVILTDLTTLTVSDLVLNSDYTVAGAGVSSGGSVTTATVYSSNYRITILRNVPLEQQTHYVEGDPFPAESHEEALDKLTMIVQQQAEALNRAVTGNAGSPVSYALPAPQAGYALGWDAAGQAIVNCPNTAADQTALIQSIQQQQTALIQSSQQKQTYTAFTTGGTAPAFTLTPSPAITSYAEPLEFEVKFNADGTIGSNTLNISGLGALNLKQYVVTGAKIPADVRRGCIYRVRYDGTDLVVLNPLVAVGSLGPQSGALFANFTLTQSHAGKMQILCGAGLTVTLPATNSIPSGTCFILKNEGSDVATISLNGNLIFDSQGTRIAIGETVVIQSDGGFAYRLLSRSMNSLGLGQTWSEPTRSFGTTYTNITGRSIMVLATASASSTGNNVIAAYINETSIGNSGAYTADCNISFIVPPGATYRVSVIRGSMTKALWYELS